MDNRIGLNNLASMLSEETSKNKKTCEEFIRQLFALTEESLQRGENVKIKGIGTFKIIGVEERKSVDVTTGKDILIPAHKKVVFLPSKDMASAINSPFEAFEAVELAGEDDDIEVLEPSDMPEEVSGPDMKLAAKENHQMPEPQEGNEDDEEDLSSYRFEEQSDEELMDDEATSEAYLYNIDEAIKPDEKDTLTVDENESPTEDVEKITGNKSTPLPESREPIEIMAIPSSNERISEEQTDNMDNEEIMDEYTNRKKNGWIFFGGLISGIAVCAIVFIIGFFCGWYVPGVDMDKWFAKSKDEPVEMVIEQPEQETAEIEDIPDENPENDVDTEASDSKIYDTVTTTRYLTTIAREHYGNYNLWPYIYEENKSILGHPDRIKPGTRIVIPSLSKYGVNPSNREDINKAKALGAEIYARYK